MGARALPRSSFANSSAVEPLDYLVPAVDPKFGNKIVKVTNPNCEIPGLGLTWGRVAIHHYSIDQAWNADQSLLILFKGNPGKLFLDGTTYKPLFAKSNPGAIRWHRTNPALMVFVGEKGVGYWDVRKNALQVLNPLSGYSNADIGVNKGNLSDDGTMLAITATRSDRKKVIFAYDLASGKKYPDIDMSGWYSLGWTTISPLKRHIISYSAKTSGANKQRLIFTLDGQVVQSWTEYERPGHGDFALNRNGEEVFIGRSKSPPDRTQIIARRLVDGQVTVLSQPCFASHVSKRNLLDPGWFFATFTPRDLRPGFAPYTGEIAALSMDGQQTVRRLVQTHAAPNGYPTEPHGSPSPDGRRVIFASNWGEKDGPIAAYVAEYQ
jgi:hypothetical protein